MVNMHHEKALKASSSKGAGSPTNDADNDGNENGSSFDSGDLNFGVMSVGNKMLKSFPLPVMKIPLPEFFPTVSEEVIPLLSLESFPW
nr:hypothetical protein [Tanacetum cinerariifolium]